MNFRPGGCEASGFGVIQAVVSSPAQMCRVALLESPQIVPAPELVLMEIKFWIISDTVMVECLL